MSEAPAKPPEHPNSGMRGTDLTVGSIPRHLVIFSLPMLAGSLIQTAYGIVNAIWVGRGLGTEAMAAITVIFPVIFVLFALAAGLSMAVSIIVSQRFGARDREGVQRAIRNGISLTAMAALLCVVLGHSLADELLSLMQTPADVLPSAIDYMRLFIWTTPFMFGIFLLAAVLRGVGDARTPLWFQAVSLLLTVVLDPILMFGWLGMPRLGLNGTAIATIISQALALFTLVWYLRKTRHIALPELRGRWLEHDMVLLILKVGIPSMLQQVMVSVGMVVVIGLVNGFGKNATAAFGASMRLDQLAFMPAMTLGMAMSNIAGQNIGAGKFDRVRQVFFWGLAFILAITIVPSLLAAFVPGLVLRAFLTDPEVIQIGVGYLHVMSIAYLLFATMFASNGVINGSGHTLATTGFTLLGMWGIRIPLAFWMVSYFHQVEGIWYAMLISIACGTTASLAYFFSGRWQVPVRGATRPT